MRFAVGILGAHVKQVRFVRTLGLCWIASMMLLGAIETFASDAKQQANPTPNVVIMYADDLGYADLGCFGGSKEVTPNLDRMASEGNRFTDFYVAQAVCSASRTALLTGCYPQRLSILGALGPKSNIGINESETTMGELFRSRGYATAVYGKWHLGDDQRFLPLQHGFDDYLGLPYSNDMTPKNPEAPQGYPLLPLIDRNKIVKLTPDQGILTKQYTERAVKFIETNKDRPFFLYVPYTMPHVPLFVSEKFKNKTGKGLHADVIAEIDWSAGEILGTLKKLGLDEKTLVIFSSDNGPWLSYGNHAGSAGNLREGKGTSFDGGVRVPCIIRWPGKIPPHSVCKEPAMTIDLFPTLANLIEAKLPELPIDGKDIRPLIMAEKEAVSPQEAYYFYWNLELQAIRSGKWKLHFPHEYRSLEGPDGKDGIPAKYVQRKIELSLFDLENDIGEQHNVIAEHPEVAERLQKLADLKREDLGDSARMLKGKGIREPGRL